MVSAEATRKAALLQGSQYVDHPSLLQLEILKLQMSALTKANLNLVVAPDEMRTFLGSSLTGVPFFANAAKAVTGK